MRQVQRSLLVALLTLAAGMALVALALRGRERDEQQRRADEAARRPLDLDVESAQAITLRRGDQVLALARNEGGWRLTAPVHDAVDALALERLLQALGTLRTEQAFAPGAAPDLALAGLDPPALELEVVAGAARRTVQVGAVNRFDRRVYLRVGVDPAQAPVSTAAATLRGDLDLDLFALRDKRVARCAWDAIEALEAEPDPALGRPRYHLQRDAQGAWRLLEPAGYAVDPGTAEALTQVLCAARYVRVVDEAPRALAERGLEPPQLTLRLTQGGQTTSLRLGAVLEAAADRRHALRVDGVAVVLVAADLLTELAPTLFELREKRWLPIDPAQVARLAWTLDDGRPVVVERQRRDGAADAWVLRAPQEGMAAPGRVEAFVRLLTEVEALRIEEPDAADGPSEAQLAASGLQAPRRSVRLEAADGAELATLLIGAERGEELWVWRRGAREVLALERRALDAWPRIVEDLVGDVDDTSAVDP